MRVLIVGATGFIGRHVVRLLVDRGHEVGALHRGETKVVLPGPAREILADRDRLADSRSVLQRFAPDVVLDMVLYTEDQARQLVELFRGRAGRLIAVSSADVYRNYDGLRRKAAAAPDPAPVTEGAPLRTTRYPYRGESLPFAYANDYEKILVEEVVMNPAELPATVLRLPAVYGPGDRQHRVRQYLQPMIDGRSTIVLDEQQAQWRWTRGFVENVAEAVALAVTHDHGSSCIYNVGDEPTLTEREWVEAIGAAAGWKGRIVTSADESSLESRQPFDWRYHLWIDTRRIRSQLGYAQPIEVSEAVRRTVEWERGVMAGGDG